MVSLFVTLLSLAGLSPMQISLIQHGVATAVLFVWIFLKDSFAFRMKLKDLWLIMLNGLLVGVLFNFFYFTTIIHSRASVAAMLLYTSPIFVMIFPTSS